MLRIIKVSSAEKDFIHPIAFDVHAKCLQGSRLRRGHAHRLQPIDYGLFIELTICREFNHLALCDIPTIRDAYKSWFVQPRISMDEIVSARIRKLGHLAPDKIFGYLSQRMQAISRLPY